MAAAGDVDPAVLKKFAQKLAGNEKKFRDRAVKMLRKWLSARSETGKDSLSRDDFLKIWKGLHYCMWMSDKPLVQEELAVNLSELVHSISNPDAAVTFVATFFQTESREWFNIDRLRLDKFMMLIRKFLRQMFVYLHKRDFPVDHVEGMLKALCETVLSPDADSAPEGLKLHIADIYLDELTGAAADELSEEQVATFLDPYCIFVSKVRSTSALHRAIKEVFFPLIAAEAERLEKEKEEAEDKEKEEEEEEEEEEEDEPTLKVDYAALADRLFALASGQDCRGKNRKAIYSLIKTFKNLAQGIPPEVQEIGGPPDRDPIDYNAAVQRLKAFEDKLMLKTGKSSDGKKRKKTSKSKDDGEEPELQEEATEVEEEVEPEEPPKKKKKKEKKVSQMNGFHEVGSREADETDTSKTTEPKSKKKKKKEEKLYQENPAKTARKEKLKKAKELKKASKSVTENMAVVLNVQSENGGTKMVVEQEADVNADLVRQTLIAMQQNKKGKKNAPAEEPLFTGGFVDSDDEVEAAPTPTKTKSKKKQKKASKNVPAEELVEPTVSSEETDRLQGELDDEVFSESAVSNLTKKMPKKKKLRKSLGGEDSSAATGSSTPPSTAKPKKGKHKAKQIDNDEDGEVEIFVPNKKYNGPMKAGFQKEMKRHLGLDEDTSNGEASSPFAKFEKGAKPVAAFVRRAMDKATKTPNSEPKKSKKSLQEELAKKRRVSFGLDKNRSQDFVESLVPSPVIAFNPSNTPDKAILKTWPKKELFQQRQKLKKSP